MQGGGFCFSFLGGSVKSSVGGVGDSPSIRASDMLGMAWVRGLFWWGTI